MKKAVLLVVMAIAIAALPVQASDELIPFIAKYRVIANHVPTGITAVTTLSTPKEDVWNMHFEIDSLLVNLNEEVNFSWDNCYSRPNDYIFDFSGFGLHRRFENTFDWEEMIGISEKKKDKKPFHLSPITSDPLSFSMMVVCDLRQGKQELNYHIAYKGGVYHYRLKVDGEEKLKTPAGTFNTTKITRIYKNKYPVTTIWVANDMDYFLVKMEHVENKILSGAIELKSMKRKGSTPKTLKETLKRELEAKKSRQNN